MASGTINGSTGNQYIDAKVVWSSTPNEASNTSTVYAALYYKRNNTGYTTTGQGTFSVTINGDKISASKALTITESAWVKAVEHTVKVYHNTDGTKSITISASGRIPATTLDSTSVSSKVNLDTIPRASTITSAADTILGTACNIKWTPNSKSFRYKIAFYLGSYPVHTTGAISPNRTTAFTYTGYTIPLDVAKKIPTAKSETMHIFLYTFSDSECNNLVGSRSETTIKVTVPENGSTKPTATMTLSPVNSLVAPFNTLYIQGRTMVQATFTEGEGKYGADIVSYTMLVVGGKGYGSPYKSDYLSETGNIKVQGVVTDSRGFTQTYQQTIVVIPYSKPSIIPMTGESSILCARCDENGNLIDDGTYLKIKAKRSYSKVESNGEQKNFCIIRYRYKQEGGSYSSWATILAEDSESDEIETSALLDGMLLTTKTYIVQVGVVDNLGETDYTSIRIPTDKVFIHRAGSLNSLGIGKYAEDKNTFDVAQDITAIFRGNVRFVGEAWLSLELGTGVSASTVDSGRRGSGVQYRVCAGGKHIYVAFNVSFTTSSSTVRVESEKIPYPPDHDVYALCPVGFTNGSRGIATVSVSPSGRVNIYAVHKLPGATLSTGETVDWIDGYIDYWT